MSKETILATMIHHHEIIMGLLDDFGHCLEHDTQLLMDAYDVLKWEFDKHLFIEEKIVFMAQELHDLPDVYELIPRLVSDHEKFEKMLLKMRNDIKKNNICNFLEFKELIYNHKDFEEKSLYPLLDEKLNNEKKTRIIKRINEISLDGNKIKNIKIECAECGKKIGFLTAFTYPVFGRRWHFCSSCYDKLEEEERKENNLIKGRELWKCMVCGYIYNPEKGDSDYGIQPGISFEDLPDDWVCPVCSVGKNKFKKV